MSLAVWVSYREKGVTGGTYVLRQLDLPRQRVLQKHMGLRASSTTYVWGKRGILILVSTLDSCSEASLKLSGRAEPGMACSVQSWMQLWYFFFLNCTLLVIGTFTSVNDIVEDKMSHQFSGQGSNEKKCVYPAISINLYHILKQVKIYININWRHLGTWKYLLGLADT